MALRGLWGLAVLLSAALLGYAWSQSQAAIVQQILHWGELWAWQVELERMLSPERWQVLRLVGSCVVGCLGLGLAWAWPKLPSWQATALGQLATERRQIRSSWAAWSRGERWGLLGLVVLVLGLGGYNMSQHALQYDEQWSYYHFSRKGWLFCAIAPQNNHILYSIWMVLSAKLPLAPEYSLRLPALLGAVLALLTSALALRKGLGKNAMWAGLGYLAWTPPFVFYALYARGYSWMMAFGGLGLWAVLHLLENPKQGRAQFYYALAWIGAVYSNFGGLYLGLGLALAWLPKLSWNYLKIHLAIGLALGLLLCPQWLAGGFEVLWAASQDSSSSYPHALAYWQRLSDWWWVGQKWDLAPLYGLLWLCMGGMAWQNRAWLGPWAWASLPLLSGLVGVFAPFRIWCFVALAWAWCWAWLWQKRAVWGMALGLALGLGSSLRHGYFYWSYNLDKTLRNMAEILRTEQVKHCQLWAHYPKAGMDFYGAWWGLDWQVSMVFESSRDYRPFDGQIEAVIWHKNEHRPPLEQEAMLRARYRLVKEADELSLWLLISRSM
jgi:hypothetical protein